VLRYLKTFVLCSGIARGRGRKGTSVLRFWLCLEAKLFFIKKYKKYIIHDSDCYRLSVRVAGKEREWVRKFV